MKKRGGPHAASKLEGMTFGKLTVLYRVDNDKWSKTVWMCRCQCGARKRVRGDLLKCGNTTTCGSRGCRGGWTWSKNQNQEAAA